jgi:hypothetical protein
VSRMKAQASPAPRFQEKCHIVPCSGHWRWGCGRSEHACRAAPHPMRPDAATSPLYGGGSGPALIMINAAACAGAYEAGPPPRFCAA